VLNDERDICSFIGQTCGGIGYSIGRCAKGLKCSLTGGNLVGHCISLIKRTAAPVQKLLTSKAFVEDTNLEQLSNFPRQNIPSHPVSKMAETDIHLKQESILPEKNTKYSVDSSELGGKNPAKIDNVTAVVNTTHDQAHQKKPDKGTVITLFPNRFNLLQQVV